MRKNTIYNLLSRLSVVLAIILSGGCTDEEIMKGTPHVEEGVPVQVSIPFSVKRSSVWTRAAQSAKDEQRINILYVIAFNEDGSVSGRAVYNDQNNADGKGKIENFPMTSGNNKKIFIVANPQSGVGTLDIDKLNAVNNLDAFKQLNTQLLEPMNVERNYLMMLGQMKNADGGEDITIGTDGSIPNTEQTPVQLERLDTHIRFVIKVDKSEHTDIKFTPRYYAVENIPQGSYLVPRGMDGGAATDEESRLNKNGNGSYYDYTEEMEANKPGSGYKSMSVGNSTTKYFDEGYLDIQDGNGTVKCPYFEFYLLENRRQYKKRITPAEKQKSKEHGIEDAAHLYALRAKREKKTVESDPNKPGKTEENGGLIFANDHSACVHIYGTLEYTDYDEKDKMMKFYTANVVYTVFLGATGNKGENGDTWYNSETLVNDYNTVRNGFYTYTVTLSGVQSMRVEVEVETGNTPKEQRPDVEGDVIVAGGEVHSMDAHYGRTLIRLSKKDIQKGLAWAVSTPLCSGMKNIKSELLKPENATSLENEAELKTDLQLNDYKWVLFAINKEYPSVNHDDGEHRTGNLTVPHDAHYCRNVLVKFPGYQCYNGGGTNGNEQAPALGGNGATSTYYNGQTVKLYDVNQLLNRLCLEAQKDNSGIFDKFDKNVTDGSKDSVTISVFVDEFVYYYDPTAIYYKSPLETINEADLLLWKQAVNGENRYLHICKAGAKYSPDGNTSWANSVVSISQRPIYTFYNENDAGLESAWGTESIIEAGDAEYPDGELWVNDEETPTGDGNTGNKYQMYAGENLSTYDNGRLNNIRVLFGPDENRSGQELKWSTLRSVYTDVGALRKGYRDIWHACLMRNRDLNGNDIVEENEIRWYLASIDQLTDLWIGQYSVPNAKLYDDARFATTTKVRRYHIASSTFYDNEAYRPSIGLHTYKNPFCLWGEEGASIGGWYVQYKGALGLSGSHKNTEVQKKGSSPTTGTYHVSYRCVRNLGILLTERDEVPEDYVSYEHTGKRNEQYGYMEPRIYTRVIDGKTYYECRLNINRLDANSRRAPLGEGGFLIPANERNFNNRPYNGLALLIEASDNEDGIYEAKNWQDAFWNEKTDYPCPRGYRIPNQRELMLLYTTWRGYFQPKNNTPFMCKTSYGYNGIYPYGNGKRYGFAYEGTNLFLIEGDKKFAVRAVRDWTPGTND